jgi:SagB-type dehydrogenase family enzyme
VRPVLQFLAACALLVPLASGAQATAPAPPVASGPPRILKLPAPALSGKVSVEEALKARRSLRDFEEVPLTLQELSQLCWSLQGVTDEKGHRTAPSAMASYPLKVYVVAGNVSGLASGLYRYLPDRHELKVLALGDKRPEFISRAVGDRAWLKQAPVLFLVVGVEARLPKESGQRGVQFMWTEAGLAAENALLQAVSLRLGGTFVGGFDPGAVKSFFGLPKGEEPLALLPVGRRAALALDVKAPETPGNP